MHRAGAVAATFAFFGLAACLGFGDLEGGEVDAGNVADSNADTAFSDATNDTGNTGDSSIDAGFDAGNSYCSKNPGHSFCDDFDESTDILAGGWLTDYITSPSNLALTSDASVSAPTSLLAYVPASGETRAARLAKLVPLGTTHVHVEFDLQMCDVSTLVTGTMEIFKLGFDTTSTGNGVAFQVKSSGAYIATNGMIVPLSINLSAGTWTHVVVDLHLGNNEDSLGMISFNGLQVSPQDASIDPVAIDFDAGFFSVLGLYGNDAPTCTSLFDNVTMDFN
jgi:hypothetical protein